MAAPRSFSTHGRLSSSPAVTPLPSDTAQVETLISYHDRTKHNFNKYADGPHGLDWANQPDPFRRYTGAPIIPLTQFPQGSSILFNGDTLYPHAFSGSLEAASLSKDSVSQLLYHSFALSAWKSSGFSTWGLRCNPSSGNLHPTEAYIISGPIPGISGTPFVAHYYPKEHALEIRCEIPSDIWMEMQKGFPNDAFFVGLTSIYWREAWKYGERAFRYCNHDVGHALGAISIASAGLGWDAMLVDGWGTDDLDHLLGTHGRKTIPPGSPKRGHYPELEQEHADCLVACFPSKDMKSTNADEANGEVTNMVVPPEGLVQVVGPRMSQANWMGRPNRLSKDHVWWQVIDKAAAASRKLATPVCVSIKHLPSRRGFLSVYKQQLTLWEVIFKRRSAVNMDGRQSLSANSFYQALLKMLPSGPGLEHQGETAQPPFRILPWMAEVHLAIFVHRVEGLPKGIYVLVRNSEHEQKLRQAMRPNFMWEKPPKCPENLPLYILAKGNCEQLAMQLSCFQEIAGFGCFSLGMISRLNVIKENGAWMYPRLYWECGVIGQLLYLEAHALGISATGIGCYFDDPVHEVLGLKGHEFQSLYHFTVGVAVEDKRITGLPPYPAPV